MTVLLIYKLESGPSLKLKGRWDNGTWILDKEGFSQIDNIEEYDAEMIEYRFDGPIYYTIEEAEAPLTLGSLSINGTRNGGMEEAIGSFAKKKPEKAEDYRKGRLDKSAHSEEEWELIKSWAEEYG